MTIYALSDFDIRVLNGLLDAEDAGVDLIGRNGERRALDEALAPNGVDQIRLFEVQTKLGIFTAKSVRQLKLNVSDQGALPYSEAMELTLSLAKDLRAGGYLLERGPPPSAAESTRAILTARDIAAGGEPNYA